LKDEGAYVSLVNRLLEMLFSKYANLSLEHLQAHFGSLLSPRSKPQSTQLHSPIKDFEEVVHFILSLTYMMFSFECYYPMGSELLSRHFKHVKRLASIDPEVESRAYSDDMNGNEAVDDELSNIISEVARLQVNIQVFVVYELSLLPREFIQLFLTW
jgi:hypothetical protein